MRYDKGAFLKHLINASGKRIEEITSGSGISRQSLNQWASGEVIPTATSIRKLAKYFKVEIDLLMPGGK